MTNTLNQGAFIQGRRHFFIVGAGDMVSVSSILQYIGLPLTKNNYLAPNVNSVEVEKTLMHKILQSSSRKVGCHVSCGSLWHLSRTIYAFFALNF